MTEFTTPVVEEPQNALTRKFSEKEWTAVKELRTILPLLLQEAFPDEPEAKVTPFEIWGVQVDPNRLDAKGSVILGHYVRAMNFVVADAGKALMETVKWRKQFNAPGTLDEKFPDEVFGKAGHIFGTDNDGRPVTYNVYGAGQDTVAIFEDTDRFLRWRVALMERALRMLDFETLDNTVQIHDYLGVSMSSRTAATKKAASEATTIFRDHYPETLYKKYFVNVPTLMAWIFWIFKPLLPARTQAKMTMIGTGSEAIGAELLKIIPAKQLPKQYGGEADAHW